MAIVILALIGLMCVDGWMGNWWMVGAEAGLLGLAIWVKTKTAGDFLRLKHRKPANVVPRS